MFSLGVFCHNHYFARISSTVEVYNNLKENSTSIYDSRDRMTHVIAMGHFCRSLTLINSYNNDGVAIIDPELFNRTDYHLYGYEGNLISEVDSFTYTEWVYYCLTQSAKYAKLAQNRYDFGIKSLTLSQINDSPLCLVGCL